MHCGRDREAPEEIDDQRAERKGEQALKYLFATGRYAGRNIRNTPVLVRLDLKMPKVDGLSVVARIRANERTPIVPVVVLTSSAEEQNLVRSYKPGGNSYVRKAVDCLTLVDAARQPGVYWRILNQQPERDQ